MFSVGKKISFILPIKGVLQKLKDNAQKTVLLDATWYLPTDTKNGKKEYLESRLPGAQYFDIDEAKDHKNPLPHMLPPADEFASYVGKLGIDRNTNVIIYDRKGFFSSPRVFWTFKVFGHEHVFLFPNAFNAWKTEGLELETGEPRTPKPVVYEGAKLNKDLVASFDDIVKVIESPDAAGVHIVDARAHERFLGNVPESRPGLASGHIPTSINIPFTETTAAGITAPKPEEDLEKVFSSHGLTDKSVPIITSCGSGVTASVLFAALKECGFKDVRVYDESWSGYGKRANEDSSLLATGP
ncbi:putative 3-mercaptopyruvate sulfurtransferase [Schizosaccharomyces pombe]|uniref:Probable 3-mercaptopyruvate sulfurtransferase n=1 Tax=Schizosaccharomyces pombe (strain 972 / ATCC 24843) TaxID=284812 RepID=THTM_SCHPO|nr:putative thiosulfate sulfurtransferase Tum1 [Schizosaccharomyces pombe]Q9USJ1.2 RecName: Full=Probable 3-mercaptopyruvate sulfurtransferase; Short=MST [Schizosaccharomyces pombe 972h-]CAB60675.2 thiosulfate sulfurtransferase, involved in tRNA wobble position thiolation Tum1 (predicted) [Schizosaccharomyces pombe]|eukprot:NP_001342924.1 putative thiosulfate sulfurtransferase Tum1 [Schizosaccharomyces pombe]